MNERMVQELELLRRHFPELEYREEARWILLPRYPGPKSVWTNDDPDVCFQIGPAYPGQKPYGFHVRLPFALVSSDEIKNATPSEEPVFEGQWLKVSWDMPEWNGTADLQSGYNLLNWALSFRKRLEEGA